MPARVVHHTHASLGPAWRRSHAGRNLTSLPTGKVGRPHQQRTVQEKVEGWVAVMGTRCTGGRPCTRSAACPTPWPVATHPCPAPRMAHGWQSCSAASSLNVSEPNSGNRPPPLESLIFCALAHQLRCHAVGRPAPGGPARLAARYSKQSSALAIRARPARPPRRARKSAEHRIVTDCN